MDKSVVGKRLLSLRESVKLSQLKLAAVSEIMAQPAVYRYENSNAFPPFEVLTWYADYFDVSLDYIFGRTDNPRGKIYDCKSQYIEDNKDLKEFVEMCFDPNSPVNVRLKDTMLKMLEDSIKRVDGTMPEDLPTSDKSISQVEREQLNKLKKRKKPLMLDE